MTRGISRVCCCLFVVLFFRYGETLPTCYVNPVTRKNAGCETTRSTSAQKSDNCAQCPTKPNPWVFCKKLSHRSAYPRLDPTTTGFRHRLSPPPCGLAMIPPAHGQIGKHPPIAAEHLSAGCLGMSFRVGFQRYIYHAQGLNIFKRNMVKGHLNCSYDFICDM